MAASESPSASMIDASPLAFRFEAWTLGPGTSATSLPLGSSVSVIEGVALDLAAAAFRPGVLVTLAVRERVLLPRFSSGSSESGSGSGTLAERVRVGF